MPTFKANDGISLHYETHGSKENKPLILVNYSSSHHQLSTNHLIVIASYTASPVPAKSSNVT